jgi:D-glycero-beta-D-manno-heptose-7-phosphate kinase
MARNWNADGLEVLADRMVGKRVLVIGDIVADEYIYGETLRISREAPVLVVRYERAEVRLGGAGNAAANLKALGAEVTAIGVIGRDEMGRQVRTLCDERDIRLVAATHPDIFTETKTRIMAGGISTRRQQIVRVDRGGPVSLPKDVVRSLLASIRRLAKETDAILVSDYGGGVLGPETIAQIRTASARKVPVCVDSRYSLSRWRNITVAKPNEPELAALSGMAVDSETDLTRAGRAAIARLRTKALLVTRGRNGMALLRPGMSPEFIPAHGTKEAVDVTGAGDTGIAAMALAVAAGGDFLAAAQLANVAAAIVVQKPGAATASREELFAELSAMKNGTSEV